MASQQQQPGGPMAQPGLQQPTSLQQQQHQLSQQQDFDPVHRFKMLIPQLKESLQVTEPPRRKTSSHNKIKWAINATESFKVDGCYSSIQNYVYHKESSLRQIIFCAFFFK